ncbi:AbrB family transcriptional regulator [bacterium]|nr:MAG: AbrB family transcriptional regulator [bacterium]
MKSMSDMKPKCGFDWHFFGTSTLGERGQLVIPAEARAEMGMSPGDKILVIRHPMNKGLMLFKLDSMREVLDDIAVSIQRLESEGLRKEETE